MKWGSFIVNSHGLHKLWIVCDLKDYIHDENNKVRVVRVKWDEDAKEY